MRFEKRETVAAKCQSRVRRGVVITVCASLLLVFLFSFGLLTMMVSGSESKFARLAMEEHQGCFFWTNIELIRGYAVVALLYILLVYPVVRLWIGDEIVPARWSVMWRTLAGMMIVAAWFNLTNTVSNWATRAMILHEKT